AALSLLAWAKSDCAPCPRGEDMGDFAHPTMMDAFAHCEMLVRTGDRERYLSALFAPAEHRRALFALYAFNLEIARIREVVRNPGAGEIRLAWWREVLRGEERGGVEGNPVAAALRATVLEHGLSEQRLTEILDARSFDLGSEP